MRCGQTGRAPATWLMKLQGQGHKDRVCPVCNGVGWFVLGDYEEEQATAPIDVIQVERGLNVFRIDGIDWVANTLEEAQAKAAAFPKGDVTVGGPFFPNGVNDPFQGEEVLATPPEMAAQEIARRVLERHDDWELGQGMHGPIEHDDDALRKVIEEIAQEVLDREIDEAREWA